jgi:anti-sigma factor RsiW
MESFRLAGLSLSARVVAVLGAMLASVLSFGAVVVLYASASGELEGVVAKVRAAPAASAVAVEAPRKPKSG